MHYRLRNVAVGHGGLAKPTSVDGCLLYRFEAPTEGVFFRKNETAQMQLIKFDRDESFIHFAKNPTGTMFLHRFDTDNAVDADGRRWGVIFRKFSDSGVSEYPFAGTLTADASSLTASPAGFVPDGYTYFHSYSTAADGFWYVYVYPKAPDDYSSGLSITLDMSGYPGALLSNTHYSRPAIWNHPLPFSNTGTIRLTVGGDTTPPIIAYSHPDVARAAMQALPSVNAAGLAVVRTQADYETTRMLREIPGTWQFYIRQYFTGFISSGTFTLTWNGQTTAPISTSASSAEIAAAVNALSGVSSKGYCTITRLRRGLWSEDGYNPDDCADNGAISFRLTFYTT